MGRHHRRLYPCTGLARRFCHIQNLLPSALRACVQFCRSIGAFVYLYVSNRLYENHYEIRNYLGLQMRVMVKEDMFAHKLCALLDRTEITSRDVFDCWFFLKERTSINKAIVESRMGMPFEQYLDKCIEAVRDISEKSLISGLGELTNGETKNFVRRGLKDELISLLTVFKAFPSFF